MSKTRLLAASLAVGLGVAALLFAVTWLQPAQALGDTYYVSAASGSDTTGNGSAGSPWQTIAHAAANVPAGIAGDPNVIAVAAGTYDASTNGEVFPILFANAHVRLSGAGAGAAIIEGEGATDIVSITVPGIAVDGFTIQGAVEDAIATSAGGLAVTDNVFQDVGWGVHLEIDETLNGGSYAVPPVLVEGNTFTVSQEAVVLRTTLDGDNTETNVTIGDIDILSNTVAASGPMPGGMNLVNLQPIDISYLDGGSVSVGQITVHGNELGGHHVGVGFDGGFAYLTDTLVSAGDVTIIGNTIAGQDFYAISMDYYDAWYWYGTTSGTLGSLVIRDNTIDSAAIPGGRGIYVNDLGNWSYLYDDAALAVGTQIIEDNVAHTAEDALYVNITEIQDLYDSASVTLGEMLLVGNVLTTGASTGDGIFVQYSDAGYSLYTETTTILGSLTIAENTVNAAGRGVYVYAYDVGAYIYGSAVVSMGEIAVVSNTLSGTYGVQMDYTYCGTSSFDNSSTTLGGTTFADNLIHATTYDGIYYYLYYVGHELYGQANVQLGELHASGNTVDADEDGITIYYQSVGNDLDEDSQFLMGDATIEDNSGSCGGVGVGIEYGSYSIGSWNVDNAYIELPGYNVTGNDFDVGSYGFQFQTTANPSFNYNNALTDWGDFVIDGNAFSGGENNGIDLFFNDVCDGCIHGTSTIMGDIQVSNNTVTDMAYDGIKLYLDQITYDVDHTATVQMGDVVIGRNVLQDLGGDGIDMHYSEIQSRFSAATTLGDLRIIGNQVANVDSIGVQVNCHLEASDTSTVTVGPMLVQENRFEGCGSDGIYFYTTVYTTGSGVAALAPITVAGNTVLGCDGIYADIVTEGTFANNMVGSSSWPGIHIELSARAVVVHNTIATPTVVPGSAILVGGGQAIIGNNIAASYTVGIWNTGATVLQDYNLFAGTITDTVGGSIGGAHNISPGDPAFVDPAAGDYHITAASEAIDAGTESDTTRDIDGQPRPLGAGPDIGADEYAVSAFLPLLMRDH